MDHHSEPQCGAGDSETVQIPKAQFMRAIQMLKTQEQQLIAANNLHRLIQEKDEALTASQEMTRQLQTALSATEARMSKLLQLSLSSGTRSGQQHSVLETDSPDVEADCECPTMEKLGASSISTNLLPSFCKVRAPQPPFSRTLMPVACGRSVASPSLDTEVGTGSPPSMLPSCLPSVCGTSTTMLSVSSVVSTSMPSMAGSKDLLDKLMQQNARLKKAVREILAHKGMSVSEFLDKQEYEDTANILRQELKRVQALADRLKAVISSQNARDSDQLAKQCAYLEETVSQWERKYNVLNAYTEAIKQAHDKLKEQSTRTTPVPEASPGISKAEYTKVLEELQKLKADSDTVTSSCASLKELNEKLQLDLKASKQHCENLEQICRRNEKLQHEHDQLLLEHKLLQSQISCYQEDFNMERKEKLELKKQLELQVTQLRKQFEQTLAKHQDWIQRLAQEAQTLRLSCTDERTKNEKLEKKLKQLSIGSLPLRRTMSCQSQAMLPNGLQTLVTEDEIMADGLPAADGDAEQQCSSISSSSVDKIDAYVCPRCERQFSLSNVEKFKQHCKRCTDE